MMSRKKKILIWSGSLLGGLAVLLVVVYLIATSSWFLTGVVLPRTGEAIGMELAAEEIRVSLFGGTLQVVKLRAGSAAEPIAVVDSLDAEIAVGALLDGRIVLDHLSLNGGSVTLKRDLAGRWNCIPDKLATASAGKPKRAAGEKGSRPLQLDLNNIKLDKLAFKLELANPTYQDSVIELPNISIELPHLANGATAQLRISSDIADISAGETIAIRHGALALTAEAALADDLFPTAVTLENRIGQLDGQAGDIAMQDGTLLLRLAARGSKEHYAIEQLQFKQLEGDQLRTNFELNGSVGLDPLEAQLHVVLNPLSEEIAAIASAFALKFNPGRLQFACAGDWSVTPEKISGVGTVSLVRSGLVVIGRENYEVPELKLDLKHAFSIEPARKLADLRAFQLTLTEDGRPVVDCALQQPAEISYAPEGRHFPGAAPQLRLTVDQFNLAPVRKFLPPALPVKLNGGVLNGNLLATVEPDSEEIQLSGLTQLSNLELELPQCLYQNLNLTAAYAARVALGKTAELAKLTVTLKEKDQTLLQVVAGGDYHFADRSGSAAVKITDATLQLIPLLPLPEDQCAKLNSYARILDPLSLQLSLGADFDLTGKSFQLTALDLQGLQQQELLMRLTASPFGGTFQPFQLAEPVKAKFLLQNFALTRLQSLLPAEQLRIFRGTLSTSGEVDAAADLKSFRIAGESRQDNLDLIAAGQRLAGLAAQQQFDVAMTLPDRVKIGRFDVQAAVQEQPALSLSLTGEADLTAGATDLTLQLLQLTEKLPALWVDKLATADWLFSGKVAAAGQEKFQRWQVKGELAARAGQAEALQLSFDGKTALDSGEVAGTLQLEQLNEALVAPFWPNKLQKLSVNGALNAGGNFKQRDWKVDGTVNIPEFQPENQPQAIRGDLKLIAELTPEAFRCRQLSGALHQAETLLANLEANAFWPLAATSTENGNVVIRSEALNVEALMELFRGPEAPVRTAENAPESNPFPTEADPTPIQFNFGPRPVHLSIQCDSISWGPAVQANFAGNVDFHGRELLLNELLLTFNGAQINTRGKLVSTDADVDYELASQAGEVDLKPLLAPFLPEEFSAFSGKMKSLQVAVRGNGLKPPRLWDNLNGDVTLAFSDLEIPNSLQYTTLGKLFLLPLEVMRSIQEFLPATETVADLDKAVGVIGSFFKQTQTISFENGGIKLASRDGQIHIERCSFTGPLVRELAFSGSLGLGSRQALDLDSRLNVVGVLMPVQIDGTLQKPEVNIQKTVTQFITGNAANILSILDVTGVTSGSDGQPAEWRNALDGVVNILSPAQKGQDNGTVPDSDSSSPGLLDGVINILKPEPEKNSGAGDRSKPPAGGSLRDIFKKR